METSKKEPLNWGLKPTKDHVPDWTNAPPTAWRIVAMDQAKFNLSWLVFPAIDVEGVACLPEGYVRSLNQMDLTTRAALAELPLTFLQYWDSVDTGNLLLAEHMPLGYRKTMGERAAEAQKRLTGVERDGNVIKVEFGRKRGG